MHPIIHSTPLLFVPCSVGLPGSGLGGGINGGGFHRLFGLYPSLFGGTYYSMFGGVSQGGPFPYPPVPLYGWTRDGCHVTGVRVQSMESAAGHVISGSELVRGGGMSDCVDLLTPGIFESSGRR